MNCITTERARLYCGDCFRVLEEIPGRDVDGVIIDPPYSSGGTFSTMRKGDTYKKYCRSGSDFGKDKSFTGDNMDNECISILENISEIGVPLPPFLMRLIQKLKKTTEDKGEDLIK